MNQSCCVHRLNPPRPTSRRNRREVRFRCEAPVVWSADWSCETLGVSRGGFYAWLTRPRRQRSRSKEGLGAKVHASFLASDRTYGARRVWHDLLAEGVRCGLHRIERLMRQQALKARQQDLILFGTSIVPTFSFCASVQGRRLSLQALQILQGRDNRI